MVAIAPVDNGETRPGLDQSALERRIIDATLRCVARWGLAKTTLDDIAREAGCSRATVYRCFPGGKDALVSAVVTSEISRFFAGLHETMTATDDLEARLVRGITYAGRCLRDHDALRYLFAHEPEVILPRIAFAHMNEVLEIAGDAVAPYLAPFVGEAEAPRAAEWLTRIVCTYSVAPSDRVAVCDDDSVRALVQDFVLPGLVHPAPTT